MLKISMEFKKGILFIRLDGVLTKETKNQFNNEVLPVVLTSGIKYIVFNLDKVNLLDYYGLDALLDINEIVTKESGKTTLCSLTNKEVKTLIDNTNMFYVTLSELTALGVMKIWKKN